MNQHTTDQATTGAAPPSRTPTVVTTVLLGPIGAIPAKIAAARALRLGKPTRPYWTAFTVCLVASVAAYIVLLVGVLGVFSASGTSTEQNYVPTADRYNTLTWTDVPQVGDCYEGHAERQQAEGGAEEIYTGPAYYPADCTGQYAFFAVSGVIDTFVRSQATDAQCAQFGAVYRALWYRADGQYDSGLKDRPGYLVCLTLRAA